MLRKRDLLPLFPTFSSAQQHPHLFQFWWRHVYENPYLPRSVRVPARQQNLQALKGFEVLRSEALPAVPALIEIYERRISPDSEHCTCQALLAIGPDAMRAAIPSFLRALAGTDVRSREQAIWALSNAHVEPLLVVPALAKCLNDTNAAIRKAAVMGLHEVGFAARPAVPALVALLKDPDAGVRAATAQALPRISYDDAVKAGLK
jgi:hypothetical protein